ncbi:protein RICE SALT SENSITIVE 3 isoform X1 [Dendrobium catenatum]|uniref:Transcription factor bHLH155 n=2 Tax=Dendrobium catenatum TaxID=906689 RepID=A0A2I0XGS4_9ASPA|nr:protein RICE SALT SENSITIVE 3 isoform X1 [Dendrobium catenatum]PKU87116.1 Transcription factor bHLH155 [Dendrobium catenatum]
MVGSGTGGDSRSKEAVGMMALHEALRNVCLNSDWTYSVFWTIRPRPRCRGGNGCKVGDDNGSLMLMWEDGFCRTRMTDCLDEIDGEDPVRKAFSKMSIQLYNYGEGLMGKVASDKCHKWVFKEPSECETNISNYWQSSFDALPPEWTDQFSSGIQTIAVIQAGHGLLQLGSCKIIPEDLHFVLRMRHMFESLGYQSGFFLSQLFSSTRSTNLSPSPPPLKQAPSRPPQPLFNWTHPPFPTTSPVSQNFHPSSRIPPAITKDDTHLFLLPHSDEDMMDDHEADLKWPNGLSFFNALTGRTDDAKLLFGSDGLGSKPPVHHHQQQQQLLMPGKNLISEEAKAEVSGSGCGGGVAEEYLSLDQSHSGKGRKAEGNKFKRSFTLPVRMSSSSSSGTQGTEYRSSEAGIYSDIMETFLE